jgi:membrane protease subunit HflC
MRKIFLLTALAVVLLVVVGTSFVTVDPTVYVYVTQFGRPVAVYDGGDNDNDAGLHLRWPWPVQSVQRLDRRLQVFELPGIELLTRDRARNTIDKTLTIDAYVCWRISGKEQVDRFIRRVGTPERARAILGQRISSQLAAEVGKLSMDDLVSVQPGQVQRKMGELRDLLNSPTARAKAEADYGIRIVDVRLRRFNYPPQVRQAIFDRIRSERDAKAAEYRRQGTTQAAAIRSQAEKSRRIIVADAKAAADQLRGSAVAEGDRIRNQAHRQEREFYKFLKKLEDYARILGGGKTVLYLSTQRELFDLLLSPNGGATPSRATAGKAQARPAKKGGK